MANNKKKLIIDQTEWFIPEKNAEAVARLVREAMTNRTSVELDLDDGAGRIVTVFLNGAAAASVALDLDLGPRPSEMS